MRRRLLFAAGVAGGILAAAAVAAVVLTGIAAHKAMTAGSGKPAATGTFTDPGGFTCAPIEAHANGGYCADDPLGSTASPPPAPSSSPVMLDGGQSASFSSNTTGAVVGTITVWPRVTTQSEDPRHGEPPANGYFVIVRVEAAADPGYTDGFYVNAADFYALTPGGGRYNGTEGNAFGALTLSHQTEEITTTLAAGERATGWLSFDVPSPHGHIVYSSGSYDNALAEWSY